MKGVFNKILGGKMSTEEIKSDLETRQQLLASVSAYSSLRTLINILCYLYIGLIILWLFISMVALSRYGGFQAKLHFLPFVGVIASIIFALVLKGLAHAFLDGVDLKLLDNRRSELNRKDKAD